MRGGTALELKHVWLELGGMTILRDLSFSVSEGEIFALFGASGCGKSTTLRLISGLEVPNAGKVEVFGREAASYGHRERCVATVWQGKALFPHLSVRGNLEFGLRNRGVCRNEREARVRDIGDRLRIDRLFDRAVDTLSGGEQQRVALGRAMVIDPQILLLDEPFTGLDQILRWQLLGDLRRLLSQGARTYVLVSHEFETILALAGRAAVMQAGSVIQIDTPSAIWQDPKVGFVATLIGWSNVFSTQVVRTNGEFAEVQSGSNLWRGRLRGSTGASAEPGAKLTYVVHPHEVILGDERECRVEGVYLGREERPTDDLLFFDVSGSGLLRIRSPRARAPGYMAPGSKIKLSWDPENALVLPP